MLHVVSTKLLVERGFTIDAIFSGTGGLPVRQDRSSDWNTCERNKNRVYIPEWLLGAWRVE